MSKSYFADYTKESKSKKISQKLAIASFAFLLGTVMVFPAMAESSPLKLVADSVVSQGKVFVSVDFDHDGFCDKQAVLISVTTAEKIGITGECVLPSI